jgi:hypothetical protein
VAEVALHIEEQRHTHHRKERNDHHPGDLCTVVHLAVQQIEDHDRRDGHTAAEVVGPQIAEPAEDADQQPHLKQQEQQHQPEPAEDGVNDPLLALFQQPEAAVLKLLGVVFDILFQFVLLHGNSPPAQGHSEHSLRGMAGLHQRLRLAAETVIVPWVIEPVMLCIVAHQQQAVLVALPGKIGAVGQWSRCSGTG